MASTPSSDEGEIIENDVEDLKATSLPKSRGNGVDRQDRPRGRYSASRSPDYDDGPGYHGDSRRSRSPRGFKRHRDDRDFGAGRHGQDNRRFRIHYEDSRSSDYRRSRAPYEDLDRPSPRASTHGYGSRERDRSRDRGPYLDREREGYPEKRVRRQSRSPYRHSRGESYREDRGRRGDDRYDHYGDTARATKYDDRNNRDSRKRESVSKRATEREVSGTPAEDAKPSKGQADEVHNVAAVTTEIKEVSEQPEPEDYYDEPQRIDEDAEIERRRRRRDAILAKSSSATPLLIHALHGPDRSTVSSPAHVQQSTPQKPDTSTPGSGMVSLSREATPANRSGAASPASAGVNDEPSPDELGFVDEQDLINIHSKARDNDEDGPSAADYDPTVDMKEDERRDELRHGNVGLHGAVENAQDEPPAPDRTEDVEKPSADGEDDDDFNMFAEDFDVDKYATKQPDKAADIHDAKLDAAMLQPNGGGILEDDDKDGYYKVRIGEILNGRYQVQSALGKGMFSGVIRAVDITNKKLVAIKIMRNNDALRKGGFTEIAILQKLNDADSDNKKHIVRFWRHFDHKGHLCMAFENLSLNLREVLRKFGNNVGINLNATRAYAYQIFVALAHMRKCSVIHADLKPDNILVNESRNILKICDLGTAIDRMDAATAHNEITPYLVSRFYRAPEIILGMPYDYAIDMWSIGCTLYELYTGKILFTGESNNQMLKTIMEIRGKLTSKMYKRGQLSGGHFDEKGNFVSVERDKVLGKTTVRTLAIVKPTRDLRTRLMAASSGMSDAETRELNHFIDLLEHCLTLNPDKRIKPAEALRHPFFTSRAAPSKR